MVRYMFKKIALGFLAVTTLCAPTSADVGDKLRVQKVVEYLTTSALSGPTEARLMQVAFGVAEDKQNKKTVATHPTGDRPMTSALRTRPTHPMRGTVHSSTVFLAVWNLIHMTRFPRFYLSNLGARGEAIRGRG